jgi:hypothetical protein
MSQAESLAKRKVGKMKGFLKKLVGYAMIVCAFALMFSAFMGYAHATGTDITGVISDVSGYVDAAITVGIAVLLFVLGKRVVRRLV